MGVLRNVSMINKRYLIITFLLIAKCTTESITPDIFSNSSLWVEKRLVRDLFQDYEPRARPVTNDEKQITIAFGIGVIQILELKESEQVLTTNLRNMYRWKDFHLRWDPTAYSNITHLNLPQESIWLPDIALYNSADERLSELRPCDVRISYDGTVEWLPMAITKSTCPVHIKHFPYDEQNCTMKFGPWTYDWSRVNMTYFAQKAVDLEELVVSQEWELRDSYSKYDVRKYACCEEQYVDIKFSILIKRQAAFYAYVLILPCSLLSMLTLVLFWLPPETPAKMILGMNIFVAFFLLLLLLVEAIPNASSSFPLIGNYYCMNMALVTLSTFLCLIVVNFHFRGDTRSRVPAWIRYLIIEKAARIFCINITPPKPKKPTKIENAIPGLSGTDSMIIKESASHYQKKFRNIFKKKNFESSSTFDQRGDPFTNSNGSNKLNDLSKLAQNPDTIDILLKCGFTEDLICKLQNIHSLERKLGENSPEESTSGGMRRMTNCTRNLNPMSTEEDECGTDSADFCPACTGLPQRNQVPKTNQSNHHDQSNHEDIGFMWAQAARSSNKVFQDKRNYQRHNLTSDDESCCLSSSINGMNNGKHASHNNQPYKSSNGGGGGGTRSTFDLDSLLYSCLKPDFQHEDSSTSFENPQRDIPMDSRTSTPQSNFHLSRRVNTVIKDVTEIVKGIRFLQKLNENNEKVNKIITEWRNVGIVLDRIFFLFYVIALIVGVICFFPRSAH